MYMQLAAPVLGSASRLYSSGPCQGSDGDVEGPAQNSRARQQKKIEVKVGNIPLKGLGVCYSLFIFAVVDFAGLFKELVCFDRSSSV